eukprot:TRINITY_DN17419_c0_g1_i3.p1 TRINITY_DN17419_c0_g1~~TRINITY_DN17419_c0_g1_i3.p1  ORF type:complete len:210 (+),score=42.52 TRINITY_DN17419_c0_g1_i3:48-677(+)
MEPISVFDEPCDCSATWSQTDESVTIVVPLPALPAGVLPHVEIKPHRLLVRCTASTKAAAPGGVDAADSGVACNEEQVETLATPIAAADVDHAALPVVAELVTLLDNELSGEVATDVSAWTVMEGTLTIELAKKPYYDTAAGAEQSGEVPSSAQLRPPWWPCAVRGGRKGPPDPQAPRRPEPNLQRLDSKIGQQAEKKGNFQGKSKFQW